MIFKSYEILKKKLDNFYLYLFYGENDGLKKDIIESIINKKGFHTHLLDGRGGREALSLTDKVE